MNEKQKKFTHILVFTDSKRMTQKIIMSNNVMLTVTEWNEVTGTFEKNSWVLETSMVLENI